MNYIDCGTEKKKEKKMTNSANTVQDLHADSAKAVQELQADQ